MERILLDLIPGRGLSTCHASQNDKGRIIRADLVEKTTPHILTGTETVTINVHKPDNNVVIKTLDVVADTSHVYIVTTEQMTAVAGKSLCELTITDNTGSEEIVIGTSNFILDVEADPLFGGVESESVIENLSNLIAESINSIIELPTDLGDYIIRKVKGKCVCIPYNGWVDILGTLESGEETITISNEAIKENSTIQIFTDGGVDYNSIEVIEGSVTLTFDAQASDLGIKVRVT